MSGAVYKLQGNQLAAADPRGNVWLSASAGTGKTQVLSARVLRLLLTPNVDPSQILCLTFTKAGAAEMANRINAVLARWVRLEPARLATELRALGADFDPRTQAHARTLFASVLDCPGGGLRIDTIHAFSQWLLGNFPEEADLTPGARPMEDRERELLMRDVLADMLSEGDARFNEAVSRFAQAKDPDALRKWLMRCAGAADLWQGPRGWKAPMGGRVNALLGIPADADEDWAAQTLDPDIFPDHQVTAMLPVMRNWNTQTGRKCSEFLEQWIALPLDQRAGAAGGFYETVLTGTGTPRKMANPTKTDPQLPERQAEISAALGLYFERCALLDLAAFLTPALEIGCAFADRWEQAKTREGYLDFDDLIRKAARLLANQDASAWIRYKLDRSFDHILIDEAQDTNSSQWDIVFALIDDFFSGDGARGDKTRTIFTVGDYKQAIFGFQGTSPDNFERAKGKVEAAIASARASALNMRDNRPLPGWSELDLGRSFRTAAPVLGFVNAVIEEIGHDAFGLASAPPPHEGDDRAGLVAFWQPVIPASDIDADDENTGGENAGAQNSGASGANDDDDRDWLPAHDTLMAEKIADQVRRWISDEDPFVLEKGTRRHARAGDIMILVRKRKQLAAQIVAKLHARGVAVAGVDRLRLGDPLAVKDVMAALRFAAQPLDDLSLANLLVSPLIGWTQDDLLAHAPRPAGVRLWDHLRTSDDPFAAHSADRLRGLLALADYETPQALIAWILTGPWQGRGKLVARLGRDANDPIDELLNAAFAYQSAHTPSLTGFIEWFDAGDGELKRDADNADGQVRVMTVHGSKGLQRPIVILADATDGPGKAGDLELADDPLASASGDASASAGDDGVGGALPSSDAPLVPLPPLKKEQQIGAVSRAQERAQIAAMQENWRLLYVAITRAEEALFVGGALGKRQAKAGGPPEDSWYARMQPVFDTPALEDDIWGARYEWGVRADPVTGQDGVNGGVNAGAGADLSADRGAQMPQWALTPIGQEPRPPKPLAPSNAGQEEGADPPLVPDMDPEKLALAARRGTLIHRLLERLPDLAPDARMDAARSWLERQAGDLDPAQREEMLTSALRVLDHPDFAAIFAPGALAEVPLSATIGSAVVAGTADRLLISDTEVMVVDFKTTRRAPQRVEDIPRATMRQMAAYAAALEVIYPGRRVRTGILYTHTPVFFALPPAMIDPHKADLGTAQDNYPLEPLE